MADAKAKTINLLLYEGDLDGVISIEDSSWNSGELYSAPRESVSELLETDACNKYGVYLLLSKNMVYVGQSSDLAKRISSIVFCGHCGDIFRRVRWNNRGKKSTVWRCVSRVLKKSSGIDCPARTIHEDELQAAVVTAVNHAWFRKDAVLPILRENIRAVLNEDLESRLAKTDAAIKEQQEELLAAGNDQTRIDEAGDAIIRLREERQDILAEMAKNTELQERIDDLAAFLDGQAEAVTEYTETLVRRLVEKITVYDEKITVEFKSGLEIDVNA